MSQHLCKEFGVGAAPVKKETLSCIESISQISSLLNLALGGWDPLNSGLEGPHAFDKLQAVSGTELWFVAQVVMRKHFCYCLGTDF